MKIKKNCSVYFLQSISSSKNSGSNIWWIERRLQRACSAAAVNEKEFYVYAKCNPSLGNGWREGQGSFTQVLFQTFSNLS